MGGPEYLNPAAYAKHNPVDYVSRWKTPTLVIHGQLDYRVPYEQGLAVFTALQRLGAPSERPFAVLAFTVRGDRAVAIDVFNDRDLVAKLDIRGITA